jgi:hypothetical protein
LGEFLRRQHTEGEPGVHQLVWQIVRSTCPALEDLGEADLLDEGHAFLHGVEPAAVEQVRCVHDVPRSPQFSREVKQSLGLTVGVVEQQDFSQIAARPSGVIGCSGEASL